MKHIEFFSSPTCAPCKLIKPVLEELIKEENIEVKIFDLAEDGRDLFVDKNVRSTPTMIFYNDGKEYNRFSGFIPKDKLLEMYNLG